MKEYTITFTKAELDTIEQAVCQLGVKYMNKRNKARKDGDEIYADVLTDRMNEVYEIFDKCYKAEKEA